MAVFRFLSVLLLLLSGLCLPAQAEIITGRVVSVADGDTLTLLDTTNQTHKIRLAGIDAPEKKQDFGQKAKVSLLNWPLVEPLAQVARRRIATVAMSAS